MLQFITIVCSLLALANGHYGTGYFNEMPGEGHVGGIYSGGTIVSRTFKSTPAPLILIKPAPLHSHQVLAPVTVNHGSSLSSAWVGRAARRRGAGGIYSAAMPGSRVVDLDFDAIAAGAQDGLGEFGGTWPGQNGGGYPPIRRPGYGGGGYPSIRAQNDVWYPMRG